MVSNDLEGRVAIVTGAGQGLGRAHALYLAARGAAVVVNDIGDAATAVVAEIVGSGRRAVAHTGDVSSSDVADGMLATALREFGRVDVVVNNAGIVRDRVIVNMSDDEFDEVVRVHLRGHFVLLRAAARHWRELARTGGPVAASIINTSSGSGLWGNPGQSNYGAAKAGIAGLTLVAARELGRYGVRVNAISPQARTPMTLATPGFADVVAAPEDDAKFDYWDPANVSPLVGWLARAECSVTGQVYEVHGGTIRLLGPWVPTRTAKVDHRFEAEELDAQLAGWPTEPFTPSEA